MVAAGGAATHQQLGHGQLGAGVNHVRRQSRPNRVEPAQPAKEFGVLYLRYGARKRLVHMVMGVHHAGDQQVLARMDHFVRRVGHLGGRANGGDQPVTHQHRGVTQLVTRVVLRRHGVGVVDQQGGHAAIVP